MNKKFPAAKAASPADADADADTRAAAPADAPTPARRAGKAAPATAAKAAKAAKTAAKSAASPASGSMAKSSADPAAKSATKPVGETKAPARRASGKAAKPAAEAPASPTAQPPAKTAARKAAAGVAPAPVAAPAEAAAPAAAVAPAAALPALPIFQIYFLPGQRPGLDPAFIPLDNAGRDHPLREFAVFERLAAEPALRQAPLWGAMSWRFGQKTGLTGAELRKAIAAKPGQDLYYCNPYPEHEALYINGWQQGVPSHPAFTELCAAVLKAAGLDDAELRAVQSSRDFSACNYFVGSPAFWRAYLPWVRGLVDRARAALPAAVLRVLDSPLSDPKGVHAGSTYWPFIVERLLPLFLRQAGGGLKVHRIALPAGEARMNIHLQRLREMKDMAHRSKSRWLYGCWLNYRNLYLLQTAGAAWCKRYLPKINATEFHFR